MKRGRPRKIKNMEPIDSTCFTEYSELIETYIRLIKESLSEPDTPQNIKDYYTEFLKLDRYLINILILKAEFKNTKDVAKILHMEDDVNLVSYAISKAKQQIKKNLENYGNYTTINIDSDNNSDYC